MYLRKAVVIILALVIALSLAVPAFAATGYAVSPQAPPFVPGGAFGGSGVRVTSAGVAIVTQPPVAPPPVLVYPEPSAKPPVNYNPVTGR